MGFKISTTKLLYPLALLASLQGLLSSCAHNPSFNPDAHSETPPPMPIDPKAEADESKAILSKLQDRVQDLETRLSALNDKINLENGVQAAATSNEKPVEKLAEKSAEKSTEKSTEKLSQTFTEKKLPTKTVQAPPAHAKVIPVKTPAFASNESVDRFREAKILYDTKKYPDAVLEFSEFVKSEPDHSLAPAAQYYLGMSYYHQKEYKLAEEEFSRGLLSYAHSSYIPDTLLALSQVSEKLNKPTKVTYFRAKLLSHFPNSPQAKTIDLKPLDMPPEMEEKSSEMNEGEASVIEKPKPPTAPTVKTESAHEGAAE